MWMDLMRATRVITNTPTTLPDTSTKARDISTWSSFRKCSVPVLYLGWNRQWIIIYLLLFFTISRTIRAGIAFLAPTWQNMDAIFLGQLAIKTISSNERWKHEVDFPRHLAFNTWTATWLFKYLDILTNQPSHIRMSFNYVYFRSIHQSFINSAY
jgi:hypothetical protein